MREMQQVFKCGFPDIDRIIVKGSLKDMVRLSKGKSWLNMKHVDSING